MEKDEDATIPTTTEDDGEMPEGASGHSDVLPDTDGTTHPTGGGSPSDPEESTQINDTESIASTETSLTTKADREVRELMKSVIDSPTTSMDDQSSLTFDGSEATEIHIIDQMDISAGQSESGSVIMGGNSDQSESGSVLEVNVNQSEDVSATGGNTDHDQSENGSASAAGSNDSQEGHLQITNNNEIEEEKMEFSDPNFSQETRDISTKQNFDQVGTSSREQSTPEEAASSVVVPVEDSTSPSGMLVNDGSASPEDGNVSQDFHSVSEDGTPTPDFQSQQKSQDCTPSPAVQSPVRSPKDALSPDFNTHIRSEDNTTSADLHSQLKSQDGIPSPDLQVQQRYGVDDLQSEDVSGSKQEIGPQDMASQVSGSDKHLEEYNSMTSFSQQTQPMETEVAKDTKSQQSDGQAENHREDGSENHLSEVIHPDDSTITAQEDRGLVVIGSEKVKENKEEIAEEINSDEEDTAEGDTDSSQFAQLIVQHVLGHAVSSFNESDTSFQEDVTEAESADSLPHDKDIKTTENVIVSNEAGSNEDQGFQIDELQVTKEESGKDIEQQENSVIRSLADIQIEDSTILEDSLGGLGFAKKSEITLDSEMENETFDISVASGESTQTDNLAGITICGKGPSTNNGMDSTECGSQGLPKLAPLAAYPDFPENYGNYKVCRNLGPNVKECLFLETGENVTCKKTENGVEVNKCEKLKPREETDILPRKGSEKQNIPEYNAISTEREETDRALSAGDELYRNSSHKSQPDPSTPDTGPTRNESKLQGRYSEYENVVTSRNHRDQRMDNGETSRLAHGDGKHNGRHPEPISGQYGPVSYVGDRIPTGAQVLNADIFQDSISPRLSQTSHIRDNKIDHRILQSSSLYNPGSGLASSAIPTDQGHPGHSSRSANAFEPDRPTAMQYSYQPHTQNIPHSYPEQDVPVVSRGPLITEEDMQKYHVNFTDPIARQRYQQILTRGQEGESQIETYAKFSSEPYNTYPPSTLAENQMGVEDSIFHRVMQNENLGNIQTNQLPQGAIEGSYLDSRNDPNDLSGDLTEAEKALLTRIYQEYGVPQLKPGLPQWSASTQYDQSIPSAEVTMSTPSSVPIPTFKTLQEQQTSWMQMFKTLEERHEQEMKHQCRKHKDTIFDMQQKMEHQLFEQQQQLKRKLKAHKEALEQSSSLNSSLERQEPDSRNSRSVKSSDRSSYESPRQHRDHSPSWREIYQEVRREMDTDTSQATPPVRRSLEEDFKMTSKQSPSQRAHSSPPRLSPPPLVRSPERPRSPRMRSPPRSRISRSRSPPRTRLSRSKSPPRDIPTLMHGSRSPRTESMQRRRSPSPPTSRAYLDRNADEATELPPRAGVYSSPMPICRGKSSKQTTPPKNKEIYPLIVSPSMSEKRQSSVLQKELRDRHHEHLREQENLDSELIGATALADDVHLSSSTRVGLREKHSKHMADLREYYEKELQSMRQALRASDHDTVSGHESLQQAVTVNETLQLENQLQREKSVDLEDRLEAGKRRNQELEQQVHALEDKVAEYADFYKEAQDKICNFRSTVEELQYRHGEKDDIIEQLKAENTAHKNNLKKAKKMQEEQATYIHRDRAALEKLVEQFQANERESSILKESVSNLENKLYDARTENVEMKRTITRLELENKRLSRENDNLHHKASQGISHSLSGSIYNSLHESFGAQQEALGISLSDRHHPSPTPSRPQPKPSPKADGNVLNGSLSKSSHQQDSSLLNGSFHRAAEDTRPVRTPPRGSRLQPDREDETAIPVPSPVMRAEEELYRLRDVLRNSPSSKEPMQPKIQKKQFYGTDVITQTRRTDMSPDRQTESVKLKKKNVSSSPSSKSQKGSSKSETSSSTSRQKATSSRRVPKTSAHERTDDQPSRLPGDGHSHPNGVVSNRKPPMGDNSKEDDRPVVKKVTRQLRGRSRTRSRSASPRVGRRTHNLPRVSRPCRNGEVPSRPSMTVDETLQRVKAGEYLSRPEWEDKYTSMASKPKPAPTSPRQPTSREDRIKDRLRSIGDLEHRYDDLNTEKRCLESALSRLPSHGKSRKRKEELEENLDRVERELGSVRM